MNLATGIAVLTGSCNILHKAFMECILPALLLRFCWVKAWLHWISGHTKGPPRFWVPRGSGFWGRRIAHWVAFAELSHQAEKVFMTLMAAGPMITINSTGRIENISGKSTLTGSFMAF